MNENNERKARLFRAGFFHEFQKFFALWWVKIPKNSLVNSIASMNEKVCIIVFIINNQNGKVYNIGQSKNIMKGVCMNEFF